LAVGATLMSRRFPPPWSAEVQPNHYLVRDANKLQLAYVYYENEPGRRRARPKMMGDASALSDDVTRANDNDSPRNFSHHKPTFGLSASMYRLDKVQDLDRRCYYLAVRNWPHI
jgi:hypothetical protein